MPPRFTIWCCIKYLCVINKQSTKVDFWLYGRTKVQNPTTNICQASKRMRDEAQHIVYGGNTYGFSIPYYLASAFTAPQIQLTLI